jgi:DNA primase
VLRATNQESEQEGNKVNTPLTFVLKGLDPLHPYLKERGLSKETIADFGLGFCMKGMFKDTVAIPIHNQKGEIVAYAGRWPGDPPEGEGKYKLPPNFHKSFELFNFHRALPFVEEKGEIITVEGFFSVIKLCQAGVRNVVALMGSSLSKEQEDLLVEKGRRIILLLDNDEAGRKGVEEMLTRLSRRAFVRVIDLPEGIRQPDEIKEGELISLFS